MSAETRVIRLVVLGIIVFFITLVALLFLWTIRVVLIIVFLALVLAAAMRRPALRLTPLLGKGLSVVVLYVLLLLGVVGLAFVFIPPLVAQAAAFVEALPMLIQQVQQAIESMEQIAEDLGLQTNAEPYLEQATGFLVGFLQAALMEALNIFIWLAAFFSVLGLSFYWLLDRDRLLKLVVDLLPRRRREGMLRVYEEVEKNLGAYVWGQFIVSLIVGFLTFVGLVILNVKFALLLALLAAILEVIPTIGPVLAAIPAVLVALTDSFLLALAVVVLYVVVQQLESYVFAPKVQEAVLNISPFLILLAILVGATLFGIVGALVAVPLAVSIGVIIEASRSALLRFEEAVDGQPVVRTGGPEQLP